MGKRDTRTYTTRVRQPAVKPSLPETIRSMVKQRASKNMSLLTLSCGSIVPETRIDCWSIPRRVLTVHREVPFCTIASTWWTSTCTTLGGTDIKAIAFLNGRMNSRGKLQVETRMEDFVQRNHDLRTLEQAYWTVAPMPRFLILTTPF